MALNGMLRADMPLRNYSVSLCCEWHVCQSSRRCCRCTYQLWAGAVECQRQSRLSHHDCQWPSSAQV